MHYMGCYKDTHVMVTPRMETRYNSSQSSCGQIWLLINIIVIKIILKSYKTEKGLIMTPEMSSA